MEIVDHALLRAIVKDDDTIAESFCVHKFKARTKWLNINRTQRWSITERLNVILLFQLYGGAFDLYDY